MNKRIISLLTAFFVLISMYSGAVTVHASMSATPSKANILLSPYEIYPLPQSLSYRGESFVITDHVNLVIESAIDESTRDFLTSILSSQSLQATQSNAAVADKTNILIGTKDSDGYVDSFFQDNVDYNAETFDHQDAYVLDIDKKSSGAGNIAILGADTDAAYYGLATLKMIMDQSAENNIQSVKFEDYADAKWRGFIEGFYGFPWSHEDRMSLMRFGGTMKMNSYIFAPKDDRYHNSAWRTLYPAADLAKIKELVDVGHESKTQFVWAIHPGFNMINWNNYDAELQTLLAKLDQLYSIGVRQFGLFMDDISTSQSLTDKDKHVKLITDVANWVTAKGDVKPLIYCPPFYNQSWTGESGKPYLQALSQVPENVELMWTGRSVVGTVNATDMQWVKDATGRDPYVWLNWPVNDYKDSRLLLGKGEVLQAGTHNISGVVSNPMGAAELSKVGLFAVADYTWNVDDFNADESWLNSFDYIAPEVASELNTIAYHLSDPSPSGHGLVVGESENIKVLLEQFLTQFTAEQSLTSTGNQLIAKFDEVLNAIASFKENSANTAMLEEITPWLNSLKHVVESDKYASKSAMALRSGELITAWEELAKATDALTEARKFTIKKLNYPDVTVEAGAKRLMPFAEQLIKKLDTQIITSIDPEAVTLMPISSYGSPSGIDKMVDGDLATNVYIQALQQNGDWYGVDLGKITNLQEVSITQGRNDTDHDIFQRGVLEYSVDGQTWTAIGEERSGLKIVVKGLDLEARYVRYKLTHAGIPGGKPDLWTAVREFAVNADRGKAVVYTNVEELAGTAVTATELSVQLSNLTDIQLKPAQYLGIKLPSIERIAEISLGSTNTDLKLESSENGVEWEAVSLGGPHRNGAYFRLINDGQQDISFTLNQLMIKLNRFSATAVTHNYSGIYQGEIGAVFNGKLDAKVWFNGTQSVGKYVQVDMGGIVNVENVAVVIGDGEGDYFRKGDLQLSLDGQSWHTIHSFANPNDRSLNFPEHEVPYRFKRVQVDGGQQARYVRLISTDNQGSWLALNEIIVNEGIARPGTESPAIQATPQGALNNEAIQAIDHKLSTFYTPTVGTVPGQLNYKISNETKLSEIIIMQSPFGLSNAAVSVRDTNGWHEAGILSQSYNSIDTSLYEDVLEMKLQWDGAIAPKIHEIIPVKGDGEVVVPKVPTANLAGPTSIVGGQPFEVQLGMKSVTDSVYALDITMEYDAAVMSFDSASSLQEGISLLTTKDTPGHIRMLVISEGSDHAITGDVNVLKLKFNSRAVTSTTEGAIAVNKVVMGNAEGNESEAALSTFRIQVTAAAVGVPGDVNHDGKITIGDLALIAANYGKDSSSADWEQVKRADVTNDGFINLDDLALVASRILE
ncbi:MAG: beta-N-acetylglucosaminidase domain-containing protein [Candidatus Pristimantibacillus sp.]